jgi:hypothetical protein
MQKGVIIFLVLVLLVQSASAMYGTSLTSVNSTFSQVSVSDAADLYAYEINLDYTDEATASNYYFLTGCPSGSRTSGSSKRDNVLSVYESCLSSSRPGTNNSGLAANVSYAGNLSLRYTVAVYTNGSTEYTYYNLSAKYCGNRVCDDDESCSSCSGDCGECDDDGGGGGSGGGTMLPIAPKSSLVITPDFLKVTLKQGQTLAQTINVKNSGTKEATVSITSELISDFIIPGEDSFVLAPGESKDLEINFFAKETEPPNTHTGKIYVSDGSTKQALNVVVEVKTKSPLFDAFVEVHNPEVLPGEDVTATVRLLNMGDLRNIDVLVYYAIQDFDGNTLAFKEESIAIERTFEIVRSLKIPDDARLGGYMFYTKISYRDVMATGSEKFDVVAKKSVISVAALKNWLRKSLLVTLIMAGIVFLIYGITMILRRIKYVSQLKEVHDSQDEIRESIKAPFAEFG